jgi:hypothetical protein
MGLFMGQNWCDFYSQYADLKPDVEFVEKSVGINNDLIELVGLRYITQKHAPTEWSTSDVLRHAMGMWDSPLKRTLQEMLDLKSDTGYISMAGVEYFHEVYSWIDEFIDEDPVAFGFTTEFFVMNDSVLGNREVAGMKWTNVVGQTDEVTTVTHQFMKRRAAAFDAMAKEGILRIKIPIKLEWNKCEGSRVKSMYDAEKYRELNFKYNLEGGKYGYEIGKFFIQGVFNDTSFRYRNTVVYGNKSMAVIATPFHYTSIDEVKSYFSQFEVFRKNVRFTKYEPTFFYVGLDSVYDARQPDY